MDAPPQQGDQRVKFSTQWKGQVRDLGLSESDLQQYQRLCGEMADALWEMEKQGAAPAYPGGVGGNAAAILKGSTSSYLLVSKSGKAAGRQMGVATDMCIVTAFNFDTWSAEYYGMAETIKPTSDTPMHFSALFLSQTPEVGDKPEVMLHGHALETEEEAHSMGLPISMEETLFSTPEDTQALMTLMSGHPYPDNQIFIRKGHGFMILGKDFKEARDCFNRIVVPHLEYKRKQCMA